MRTAHLHELRIAEKERIDNIRSVDVEAVGRAADVSATQATTLAAQVTQSAEAMRNQVASVATAMAQALTAALEPITKAVDELRRSQYELQGQRLGKSESGISIQWVIGTVIAGLGCLGSTFVAFASVITLIFYIVYRR